jgi:hypothetical protein
MLSVKSTITAFRFVSSHKNDISCSFGKKPIMTAGIVSPIIMQNASMPPNANAHCAIEIAIKPGRPKQC